MTLRIRSMIRYFLIAFAVFGLTSPAAATPGDIVNIRDEMFGINDTHVFVLRTTDDNTGTYYSRRNEVFLVAIDRSTATEQYWPLYQVTQFTDFGADGTKDGIVVRPETVDESGAPAYNPYAILAERKAMAWPGSVANWQTPSIDAGSSGLSITYTDGAVFKISASDLAKRLSLNVANAAGKVRNHLRLGMFDTRQIFAELDMGPEQCSFSELVRHYSRSSGEQIQIVRMTCGDEEGLGGTSLIQVIPMAT